jgi:hypothetical protein
MAIDPGISLGIKSPQVTDPLETYGKVLQIQGAQQQQQAGALQLQQQQRDMASDEAGRKLFASGDPTDNQIMSTYGPTRGAAILKNRMEAHKLGTDIQETKAKIASAEQDYAGSMGAMIKASGNDPRVAELAFKHAEQLGYGDLVNPIRQQLQQNPDALGPLVDHLIAQSPAQQKLANEKMTAEAAKQRGIAATNADQRASVMAPDQQRELAAKADLAARTAAGQAPIQPAEQARIDQAKADAAQREKFQGQEIGLRQGEMALSQAKNAREQKIYEQTYGEGSNEALRGVEPKLRTQAASAAQKAATDYVKASRSAEEMDNFIRMAREGNKAAYANMPVAGVLEITTANGTTRINRNELEAYGGAGSLFDKISGKITGAVSGAKIPKGVLDDIEKMHQAIKAGADHAYSQQVDAINQNYKSNFKPVGNSSKGPQPGAVEGGYRFKGGDPGKRENWEPVK